MPSQYVVPQFIDVEDKIFGPIAVRPFIILLIGAGLIITDFQLFYRLAHLPIIFFLLALPTLLLALVFAFVKINGRPFHLFLLSALQSLRSPRLRTWSKDYAEILRRPTEPAAAAPFQSKQPMTRTQLAKLSLIVDTGGVYREDDSIAAWEDNVPPKVPPRN